MVWTVEVHHLEPNGLAVEIVLLSEHHLQVDTRSGKVNLLGFS
jgi:hypothetical protein